MQFTIEEIKLIKIFGFELDENNHYRRYNEGQNYDYIMRDFDKLFIESFSWDYHEEYDFIEDMVTYFSTGTLKDFLIETYGSEPLIEHRKSKLERICK